jgi:putative flippase GtrA
VSFLSRFGVPGLARSQKFRFLLVGVANTVFGYLLFAGLLLVVGEDSYVLTGVISHLVATTLSFGLNRTYVFESGGRILLDYLRFQVTYTLILALNLALLIAFVEFLGWPVLVAQAVCLFFVAVSSYLGHKYFSFRRKGRAGSSE